MNGTRIFSLRRMRNRQCFSAGDRGVTLIEFALVLPVLLIVFIGLVEFGQAYMVSRKLTTAATAVSDLVSQEPSVSCAYLDDVKLAANEIMKPFGAPTILILSVAEDAASVQSVAWSYPAGTASYTLPQAGIIDPGTQGRDRLRTVAPGLREGQQVSLI